MKKTLSIIFVVLGAVAFFACDDGIDYEKMRKEELKILDNYIDRVHSGAEALPSGLYYFNEEGTGSGDTINPGDQVQIFYATWALDSPTDSTLVDETEGYLKGHRYEPYIFVVGSGNSIKGLEEAMTYMQQGTRSHLVINSELAYGQQGSGSSIGAFQTILMEVEVYKVKPLDSGESEE